MQISASTFSDPAMRDELKQYYDDQKAALYEKLKLRESQPQPTEVKMRTANGDVSIGAPMPFSADKMIGALVSFDTWLEMQAESFVSPVTGEGAVQQAQDNIDRLEASSHDAATVLAARQHFDSVNARHQQWQSRMNEIGSYLMSLQET